MEIIFMLIPISIIVASLFLWLFIKSTKEGQFDDVETPSYRILFDDTSPDKSKE